MQIWCGVAEHLLTVWAEIRRRVPGKGICAAPQVQAVFRLLACETSIMPRAQPGWLQIFSLLSREGAPSCQPAAWLQSSGFHGTPLVFLPLFPAASAFSTWPQRGCRCSSAQAAFLFSFWLIGVLNRLWTRHVFWVFPLYIFTLLLCIGSEDAP